MAQMRGEYPTTPGSGTPCFPEDHPRLVARRRETLQVKLAVLLHKYHLSEQNGHPEDPVTAMFDWVLRYARPYSEQFERSCDSIMEVCDRFCGNDCRMRDRQRDVRNHPEVMESCPFPFDVLHTLLRDGYPVDSCQVSATYHGLVGHDLPRGLSTPDS